MAFEQPPISTHPRLRRAGIALLTVAVALGGVILLLLFFQGRDRSQVGGDAAGDATAPGQVFPDRGQEHLARGERPGQPYASDPPTSGPHRPVPIARDGIPLTNDQLLHALELGDVVLLFGTARPPAALRALAEETAGPFDPALAASGQAVVLARRARTDGVIALAWRHMLRTRDADDPQLQEFTAYWLGRGAG